MPPLQPHIRQLLPATQAHPAPTLSARPNAAEDPDVLTGDGREQEQPEGPVRRPRPGSESDASLATATRASEGTGRVDDALRRPDATTTGVDSSERATATRTGMRQAETTGRSDTGLSRSDAARTTIRGTVEDTTETSRSSGTASIRSSSTRGVLTGVSASAARISAEDLIGPIPSDFPIETLFHIAVESQGRGYAMLPNNQVGDSMLLFGVFFGSILILSFFFISVMRRWEARRQSGQMEDAVIRDDMRWKETGQEAMGAREFDKRRVARPLPPRDRGARPRY